MVDLMDYKYGCPLNTFVLEFFLQNLRLTEDIITAIEGQGFDYFSINLSWPVLDRIKEDFQIIQDLLSTTSLQCAFHAPYDLQLDAPYEIRRRASVELALQCYNIGESLDALYVNFHILDGFWKHLPLNIAQDQALKSVKQSIREIKLAISDQGEKPAVVFETLPWGMSGSISLLEKIFSDDLFEPLILMDIGHLIRSTITLEEFFDSRLATQVVAAHFHDVKQETDHLPIGAGCIDWDWLAQNLLICKSLRWILFEVNNVSKENMQIAQKTTDKNNYPIGGDIKGIAKQMNLWKKIQENNRNG